MDGPEQRVVVIDLRIPFFRLVAFFVKATLAAIPAAIIVSIIIFVLSAIFVALFGGSPDLLQRLRP
jgi:hypothetical protein